MGVAAALPQLHPTDGSVCMAQNQKAPPTPCPVGRSVHQEPANAFNIVVQSVLFFNLRPGNIRRCLAVSANSLFVRPMPQQKVHHLRVSDPPGVGCCSMYVTTVFVGLVTPAY